MHTDGIIHYHFVIKLYNLFYRSAYICSPYVYVAESICGFLRHTCGYAGTGDYGGADYKVINLIAEWIVRKLTFSAFNISVIF
ncbi:MAG: hypothetical protein ACLS48_05415 [[Eubacterium] siraeum]